MKPNTTTALDVVEHLRYGLPPPSHSRAFTVGREEQLQALERRLECAAGSALLLQADYGAGKSHLLQVLRETALDAGFAVSMVVVNAQEGVRFDRLAAIFGAVCRNIAVGGAPGRGIATLFGAVGGPHPGRPLGPPLLGGEGATTRIADAMSSRGSRVLGGAGATRSGGDATRPFVSPLRAGEGPGVRSALSSNGRWDYSEYLQSTAMYVALRAWLFGDAATRLLVEDWLTNPAAYRERRRYLYEALVYALRDQFTDPRPEWKFHAEHLLVLDRPEHSQVWSALTDLARIACAAGRRGLVLLFDEVEDIVQNLPRLAQRQDAVDNLLRFFPPTPSVQAADRAVRTNDPPLHAVFAVTPEFIEQCRPYLPAALAAPGSPLRLPVLAIAPLPQGALVELAAKIRQVHALAYGWNAAAAVHDADLTLLIEQSAVGAIAQRVRRCIQGVVQTLDERLAADVP